MGSTKSFDHSVVGHYGLNRAGLHVARMAAADATFRARRLLCGAPLRDALTRDGIVVLPNFAEAPAFAALQQEVRAALALAEVRIPRPATSGRGFGSKRPFDGGFDRHDGAALNRFLFLEGAELAQTRRFVETRLAPLGARAIGCLPKPQKYAIQELTHFRDDSDIQKVMHRDTFHPAVKLWYFIDDVDIEDGPFVYVRGSHRMTAARARWEYTRSVAASHPRATSRSGSFRVTEAELEAMGYPPEESFPVAANTVVLANVCGFHRRGDVERDGARRVAIHASLRPTPFVPFPY